MRAGAVGLLNQHREIDWKTKKAIRQVETKLGNLKMNGRPTSFPCRLARPMSAERTLVEPRGSAIPRTSEPSSIATKRNKGPGGGSRPLEPRSPPCLDDPLSSQKCGGRIKPERGARQNEIALNTGFPSLTDGEQICPRTPEADEQILNFR